MAVLTADFEAGVNGAAVLTTDPGSATAWNAKTLGAGPGVISYDNAHVYDLLAGKFATGAGNISYLSWTTALGVVTDHYGRLYLYMTAFPTTQTPLMELRSGAGRAARIDINTTGKVTGIDGPGAALFTAPSTNAIALNQWVRLEWHIIHSATVGQGEAKLFNNPDSATPTETVSGPASKNTLASADSIHVGVLTGQVGQTLWMDNIVANAAAYPGPAAVAGGVPLEDPSWPQVFTTING